jgi:hypothetical protein
MVGAVRVRAAAARVRAAAARARAVVARARAVRVRAAAVRARVVVGRARAVRVRAAAARATVVVGRVRAAAARAGVGVARVKGKDQQLEHRNRNQRTTRIRTPSFHLHTYCTRTHTRWEQMVKAAAAATENLEVGRGEVVAEAGSMVGAVGMVAGFPGAVVEVVEVEGWGWTLARNEGHNLYNPCQAGIAQRGKCRPRCRRRNHPANSRAVHMISPFQPANLQ